MDRCLSIVLLTCSAFLLVVSSPNAQTAPPPTLGEDTKGEPAVIESVEKADSDTNEVSAKAHQSAQNDQTDSDKQSFANNLLGEATIKESRRESGQIYRIELEHSAGGKQYIEENDSDGLLSSDDINLEDTPNLPKWKLGSW